MYYREKFKEEFGYDAYAYDANKDGEQRVIGFCQNYVEWLENLISTQKQNTFKEASIPMMKYLNEKRHPHTTAIITTTSCELLEGLEAHVGIMDYVPD